MQKDTYDTTVINEQEIQKFNWFINILNKHF